MNYKQIKYPQLPSCTKFFITKKYYLILILILTCFLPKQSLAKVVWKCFARNPKENHDLCTQYTTEASCKLNSACVWASEANLSADFFDGEYRCLAIEPKDNMYCFGRNLESCGPNAICYWGFSSFHKEEEEKEEEEVDKPKIIIPDLQIKLPGLVFSDENKIEKIVGKDGVTSFSIPWIGEYIKWLFNYSLGLITLLALIVLMVGGFYWLLSGGNASRVTEAKNWISAAFSGVILAMSSYILLFTINSNLIALPSIEIGSIERIEIEVTGDTGGPMLAINRDTDCPKTEKGTLLEIVNAMKGRVSYRYGGKVNYLPPEFSHCPTDWCLDCSGFVDFARACAGYNSLGECNSTKPIFDKAKSLNQQVTEESTVKNLKLKVGDLVGWPRSGNKEGHVFIYLGKDRFADAHGNTSDGKAIGSNWGLQQIREAYEARYGGVYYYRRSQGAIGGRCPESFSP